MLTIATVVVVIIRIRILILIQNRHQTRGIDAQ
jgi:hypothetical protein